MAGGWTRDGAVHEQIEASIDDELERMRSRRAPVGESRTHCAECEEPIPEARRRAVPGVKLCILEPRSYSGRRYCPSFFYMDNVRKSTRRLTY